MQNKECLKVEKGIDKKEMKKKDVFLLPTNIPVLIHRNSELGNFGISSVDGKNTIDVAFTS